MKSKLRIITVFGCILLAVGFLSAAGVTYAAPTEAEPARALVSTYADAHPTVQQLASIGYRIDYGYRVISDGGSAAIMFNGTQRTFSAGTNYVNILRHSVYSSIFLTTNAAYPVPKDILQNSGDNPYYDYVKIGPMWSGNLTLATPQSVNDLYLDGQGRIYYRYRDHKGRSINYYLGSGGFTDNPAGGSTVIQNAAKPTAQNRVYNGSVQIGVSAGNGYKLSGEYYATEAGNYTAVAILQSGYQWSDGTTGYLTLNWSISAAGLSGATVVMPSATYTGKALEPTPTLVSAGGRTLTYGKDYTCVWSSNTNAGTGSVRITGKGNYSGSVDKTFTISPADIETATVALSQTPVIYSGNACQPAVNSVVFNGKTLSAGTDYSVSYKNNVNAGTGYAVITGKGNFAGYTKEVPFTIAPWNVKDAVFSNIGEEVYTGGAITPKPSVTLGGKALTEGTDFTYSYSANTDQGTATVTVTGKGNYTGTASTTFKIAAKDLASGIVAVDIPSVTYTGGSHTPKPSLSYNGKTLAEGTDYTLSYLNNQNSGTATITVTGKGNYSGTLPLTFTIEKAEQAFVPPASIPLEALTGTGRIELSGTVSTGETTWSSSDTRVASVDESGNLTAGNKVGTATITIYNPGDGNYNPRTQSVNVKTTLTDGFFIGDLAGENTVYPTLQEAIDAAANGGIVYVAGSPTVGETANVTGKNIILSGYGAGATLTRENFGGSMLSVSQDAALTIENLRLDGKNVSGDSLVVSSGNLTFGNGASLVNGSAQHGGAVKANGGSLTVQSGATFIGNTASGNGGAIYVSDGVDASILGGEMSNNSAAVGNAVYIENGEIRFDGTNATAGITDGIGIGGEGKISLTGGLTHKVAVEFADPASQMTEAPPYRSYVESADGVLSGAEMKQYFRVVNPGYTFNGEAAVNALVLQKSKTEVARFTDAQGITHSFFDLQTAIDSAADLGGNITIELVQYKNDFNPSLNSNIIELPSTLMIPAGANITFSSVVKHTDSTGEDYTYEAAASPTVIKRADNLTGEMIRVEKGGSLTLGDVTLDGGAVWAGGVPEVTDDGKGGAGTAVTNNTGVTAHAPVIVNGGTLLMGTGATIRNNDNNYAKPGEGFGSQNYGGGVRNEGAGKFDMTGGAILNCYSREGGAVMNVNKPGTPGYVENGNPTVTVSGGTIGGNISQMKGAAVQTIYGGAKTVVKGSAVITANTSLHDLGSLSVEEGGALTVSGGTIVAGGGNDNAVYIYNKYGAEHYDKNSASKPFIEGKGAAQFVLSGSPELGAAGKGGKIFLDNPCHVVDPATGEPSDIRYQPVVELKNYTGEKVNVVLDNNRAYGDTVVSDSADLTSKVNITDPAYTTDYAHSDRYFYEANADGTYRLKYSGYDLNIGQTEPGKLTVNGVCDPAVGSIVVTIGGQEYKLSVTNGVIESEIDLSETNGVSFAATVKAVDASGRTLSKEDLSVNLKVIRFDSSTAEITVPEGTKYIDKNGMERELKNGTLPNDVGIDANGYAKFVVDGSEREIYLGCRADAIPDSELPETAGGRNDLTDTTITIEGKEGYEYNLIDANGNFVGAWKGVENAGAAGAGTVTFGDLTAGASYTVAVRRPAVLLGATVEKLPSEYVVTDKTATALTETEARFKKEFEDAYNTIRNSLLKEEGGTVTEPTAKSGDIKAVIDKYEAIAGIAQVPGLPGITDKIAHLMESYDHALANEWKEAHKNILGKPTAELAIGDKTAADAALDGYLTLTDNAKTLVAEKYAKLVETKKTIAGLEIDAEVAAWTTEPNHGNAEEIKKIADGYLAKIAQTDEKSANFKDEINLLIEQAKAALEVRGKYDALLAENSKLTETGKETLAELLREKLATIENTEAGDIETVKNAANEEILLQWQKELAKYAYRTAYEAINGNAPAPSETKEIFDAIQNAGNLTEINAILNERVNELLGGLVNEKDSTDTKGIVNDAQAAVDTAVGAATSSGKVADLGAAVETVRADVQEQRRAEKADAQLGLDADAQGIVGNLSADSRAEGEAIIVDAKRQIDEGFFADYPLTVEKALAKLAVLGRCDEILSVAGEKGYTGTEDAVAAKDAAFGKIDEAGNSEQTQEEKNVGMLALDKEEGVLILKNYLTDNDSAEVVGLVTGTDGAETRIDGAADKAEVEQIVQATVNAVDAGRFRDQHKLRKPFIKISRADVEPLKKAQAEYDALTSAVKAVLDDEAREAGYGDYGQLLADCIGKAEFEVKKAEIIDATTALVRAHDGERVREILEREIGNIEAIEYQPHTNDGTRGDYAEEMAGKLDDAFLDARVEIEHAQKQQRTENQLIRDLEEKLASGQYNDAQKETLQSLLAGAKEVIAGISSGDSDTLDRILEETLETLDEVPVSSVTTGEIKPDKTPAKPDGTGDYEENGPTDEIWGIVSNDASMPGGVKLVIEKTDSDVMKALEAAVRDGRLTAADGSALSEDRLAALVDGKEIKSTLDIYLLKNNVKITEFDGKYLVKILMTPELRSMVGLQVVYVDDDGTVQVYETKIEDGKYLVFTTTHFSEFYILGEKEFNLWWLILLLSVLLAIEIVIIFFMAKRRKEGDGEHTDGKTAAKPVRMNSFAPVLLAAVIIPNGAVAACVALGGLVAAGGGVIVALAIKGPLRKAKTPENSETEIAEAEITAEKPHEQALPEIAATVFAPEVSVVVSAIEPEQSATKPIIVPVLALVPKKKAQPVKAIEQSLIVIQYRKSFTAKLIQSEDLVKDYYSELKNESMSYGVKSRIGWRGETFRKGKKLVRIQFKGKMLALSFALSPGDYANTKYKVEDLSGVSTGKDLPCVYRIRNARRVRYAKDLIADVMSGAGLTKQEIAVVDYKAQYPYEENDALVERALIQVLTDEPSRGGTTFKKDAVRSSVTVTEAASLMKDETAAALVEEDSRLADKTRTGIVNIDTLSRYFSDGERVTLAEMKKRIPILNKKTTYVKVLARGTLDKALIVEADDFSLDAAKMILLTGGKVIRSRRV